MRLYLDLETFNTTPITTGVYRYAQTSEILLVAWVVDAGPVTVDEGLSEDFLRAFARADELIAHNAQFDRVVLEAHGVVAPITRWRCTMAQAYAHSLPGSLAALCALFSVGEEDAKMAEAGSRLVHLFCKPLPANRKLRRANEQTHPAEWRLFREYAAADVRALRAIHARLPTWNYSGEHLALWHLDQTINDRGVCVDVAFSQAAARLAEQIRAQKSQEIQELTGGTRAGQRDRLLEHLASMGVNLPDLTASTIQRALDQPDLPEPVRAILAARAEAVLTGGAKHRALLSAVMPDGRLRGLLQYCGAGRTGRWSGRLFQPQNLPRPPKYLEGDAYDKAVEAIMRGDLSAYPRPMEVISATTRGVLIAPPGRKLVVADLSAIEARVLAWLAGERSVLEAFAAGKDIYVSTYANTFGVPEAEVSQQERHIGKVQVLALGYQGGVGAVRTMAGEAADAWEDDYIVESIVRPWRAAHKRIVSLWYDTERAAKSAIGSATIFEVGRVAVARRNGWLLIRLPSGRFLCYPHPQITDDGIVSFFGLNQYSKKWGRIETYGGKLVENITQAVARDILAHGIVQAERAGYQVVLTVHDEIIAEVPDSAEFSAAGLAACMTSAPAWADGLPLHAKGFETRRFRKE